MTHRCEKILPTNLCTYQIQYTKNFLFFVPSNKRCWEVFFSKKKHETCAILLLCYSASLSTGRHNLYIYTHFLYLVESFVVVRVYICCFRMICDDRCFVSGQCWCAMRWLSNRIRRICAWVGLCVCLMSIGESNRSCRSLWEDLWWIFGT